MSKLPRYYYGGIAQYNAPQQKAARNDELLFRQGGSPLPKGLIYLCDGNTQRVGKGCMALARGEHLCI